MNITVCECQRRIVKGTRTHAQKRYMVYLVKARAPNDPYDSWLCGGALVTSSQILTSATCIYEYNNIYAIAGYRKYVNGFDIEKDNCTKRMKQKIIRIRVPQNMHNANECSNATQAMWLDIGVATVARPYNFDDISYRIHCSYIPAAVEINYNINLDTRIGTSVVALGWGRDRASKTRDLVDRNSETLREVSIKIKKKEDCINKFKGSRDLIEKYMICTHGRGLLDAEGYIIEDMDKNRFNNCDAHNDNCKENTDMDFRSRRKPRSVALNETHRRNNSDHETKKCNMGQFKKSRRQGICQNDNGGPLITWIGSTELLIGVAVNSLYDDDYNCIGPNIFISTSATNRIVKCLLATKVTKQKVCPDNKVEGFNIVDNDTRSAVAQIRAQDVPVERVGSVDSNITDPPPPAILKPSKMKELEDLNPSSIEVVTL